MPKPFANTEDTRTLMKMSSTHFLEKALSGSQPTYITDRPNRQSACPFLACCNDSPLLSTHSLPTLQTQTTAPASVVHIGSQCAMPSRQAGSKKSYSAKETQDANLFSTRSRFRQSSAAKPGSASHFATFRVPTRASSTSLPAYSPANT